MSDRSLRVRNPATNRRARPQQPSSSFRRRTPLVPRQSSKPSRPIKILQRSKSEPNLQTVGLVAAPGGDIHRDLTSPDGVLYRPNTCTDIFSSAESLPALSPQNFGGYKKEAKVVVNVTVEGSSGPIRTMVKLGSSVEETIRLVVNKYSQEGRSPQLDKDASSTFELHNSYFSLRCLSKSDVIGDTGSRSFYLRKIGGGGNSRSITTSDSFTSENVSARASNSNTLAPAPAPSSPLFFLPPFVARAISKIIRRTCKLWKILGCMHCN
ncbi:hypothetical protein U1Q18_019465 [Sarracenia purpurea var. burkii]